MKNSYLQVRVSCPLLSDCLNTVLSSNKAPVPVEPRLITDSLKEGDQCKNVILILSSEALLPKSIFEFAGLVCRQGGLSELERCLKCINEGLSYYSPVFLEKEKNRHRFTGSHTLSKREWEILRKISEGKTTNEIASLLFISPATVEVHRTHIQNKLDLKGPNCLLRFALKTFS